MFLFSFDISEAYKEYPHKILGIENLHNDNLCRENLRYVYGTSGLYECSFLSIFMLEYVIKQIVSNRCPIQMKISNPLVQQASLQVYQCEYIHLNRVY